MKKTLPLFLLLAFTLSCNYSDNLSSFSPSGSLPPPQDQDGDGFPDVSDPCPTIENADGSGRDIDRDGVPDECEDEDGDKIADGIDNCPFVANPDQKDSNNNGVGNACANGDSDGDGIKDDLDSCPYDCRAFQIQGLVPPVGQCVSVFFYEGTTPDRGGNKLRDDAIAFRCVIGSPSSDGGNS